MSKTDPLAPFSAPTRAWFGEAFAEPTRAQVLGWAPISAGRHTLLHAPTGSGKTLAAFLWCLDRLFADPTPRQRERRLRVLYVSPLKALTYDVERNLRAPLAGIRRTAERLGIDLPEVRVASRTGDTPADARRQLVKDPPEILVTTPESLYLLLTSQAREALRGVEYVIVDEVHALAGTKRGAHLALSLERLCALTDVDPQRIGLSATQRPLSAIAAFLGGVGRAVEIADAGSRKPLALEVIVPVDDLGHLADAAPDTAGPVERHSIWPSIYPRLLELIRAHHSTLVFVNSRRLAERLASRLNELAGEELVRAHHGSIAREQRLQIEEELKAGRLPALVATSSLELGIDMGAIDLVIQIEAPPSVAAGCSGSGGPGTRSGSRRPARSSRSTAVTCSRRRSWCGACSTARSRRRASRATPLTSSRSRSSRRAPWTAGRSTRCTRSSSVPSHSATSRANSWRGCSTCSRADTRPTSSPSCGLASCGIGPATPSRAGTMRGWWRSPPVGRSPTAACSASSWPATMAARAAASASWTRRWSTRAGSARSSCSAPRPGASTRSAPTESSSRRPPDSRARCPSGRATGWGVRSSSDARSGRSCARPSRCRRQCWTGAFATTTSWTSAPRATWSATSPISRRRPEPCRRIARSWSSASATSWATGGSASSRRSAAACTRRGLWRSRRGSPSVANRPRRCGPMTGSPSGCPRRPSRRRRSCSCSTRTGSRSW